MWCRIRSSLQKSLVLGGGRGRAREGGGGLMPHRGSFEELISDPLGNGAGIKGVHRGL
jgi:hypothetical protein